MSKQSDLVSVSQGASGDPLFVDAANNSVGVGTSSPSGNFQVAAANPRVRITNTSGTQQDLLLGADSGVVWLGNEDNGPLYFVTNSTERMRITNIGDVGIGTSSPVAKNHIRGSGTSGQVAASWILENFSSGTAGMDITGAAGASRWRYLYGGGPGTGTNTLTEAMCILTEGASAGSLLVNTTTATGTSKFVVASNTDTANPMSVVNTKTGAGGEYAIIFYRAGNIVGSVQTTLSGTSYVTSSDYRLKENVVPLADAADRLAQIPVHRFNFIADPDTTVDGFLAHEVQAFVPECVTGQKDEVDDEGNPKYQGIDQSKLVPLLTAALQEALQKIDALETRISALETN